MILCKHCEGKGFTEKTVAGRGNIQVMCKKCDGGVPIVKCKHCGEAFVGHERLAKHKEWILNHAEQIKGEEKL